MKKRWLTVALLCVAAVSFFVYKIQKDVRADTQPPRITVAQSGDALLQTSVKELRSVLLADVTAYDDRDGDVTASLLVEQVGDITQKGHVNVVYAAFDSAGNVAKLQRTVALTDYAAPRFTLDEPLIFVHGVHFDPLKNVGAQDLFDGDITHRIKATLLEEGDISEEGIHNVLFRVTNSVSDTAQLTLPVEVYYADRYNAQLTLKEYLVYLPQNAPFDPKAYLQQYLAFGQTTDLSVRVPQGLTLTVDGQVDTATPGVYSLCYTVRDTQSARTSCGYSRLIVVVEG